jgi:hypothetical protein
MTLKNNFEDVTIKSAEKTSTHRHVGSPTREINGLAKKTIGTKQ